MCNRFFSRIAVHNYEITGEPRQMVVFYLSFGSFGCIYQFTDAGKMMIWFLFIQFTRDFSSFQYLVETLPLSII